MIAPHDQSRLVEVVVIGPRDAERAQQGGANRLSACQLVGPVVRGVDDMRLMAPADVSAILRVSDVPVRVTMRLSDGFTTQGGEFTRLAGLASEYLALGVEGFTFGFLTRDLEVDVAVCAALADRLAGANWSFDRTFDHALEARRAWRDLSGLPGLDGIHTGGAMLGLDAGLDDLVTMAAAEPAFASVAIAAGGVRPEQVPWLVKAGIPRVQLGAAVRPGGSWSKADVDAGFVRSWCTLLDDAIAHEARRGGAQAENAS
ncbi:MAG: copper homeostasis protein CutC [Nocardioidaceae bacterium]